MTSYGCQKIFTREQWDSYSDLLKAAIVAEVEGSATANKVDLDRNEVFEKVWFVYDNEGTARSRNHDNGATHVRVTYEREVVE